MPSAVGCTESRSCSPTAPSGSGLRFWGALGATLGRRGLGAASTRRRWLRRLGVGLAVDVGDGGLAAPRRAAQRDGLGLGDGVGLGGRLVVGSRPTSAGARPSSRRSRSGTSRTGVAVSSSSA